MDRLFNRRRKSGITIGNLTFYTRHGEVFVTFCALVTIIALAVAAWPGRVRRHQNVIAEVEQTEIEAPVYDKLQLVAEESGKAQLTRNFASRVMSKL